MPNGEFEQLVLGPYDYYAIRYGYAYIPNAHTPAQDFPVLRRWASDWANPMHRFASDEDAGSFSNGHSIDPRVEMFDLSDNPIAWCNVYLSMWHGVMNSVANRFPMRGRPYDEARMAFLYPLNESQSCLTRPADTIGGEYLSRDAAGDPNSGVPLRPVPRATELAASKMLDQWLFSDAAWHFNPQVLTRLTYSESVRYQTAPRGFTIRVRATTWRSSKSRRLRKTVRSMNCSLRSRSSGSTIANQVSRKRHDGYLGSLFLDVARHLRRVSQRAANATTAS